MAYFNYFINSSIYNSGNRSASMSMYDG